MGILNTFLKGLEKTRKGIAEKIGSLVRGNIDERSLEELEEALLFADVGPRATEELLRALREQFKKADHKDPKSILRAKMLEILGEAIPLKIPSSGPAVFMIVGVNGVGKTTTIGKLSYRFHSQGRSVIIAASDTFSCLLYTSDAADE